MVTVKADNRRRVQLPDIKPGQVFALDKQGEGFFTLTIVKKAEPEPGKVKFIKKDGFTVGHTDKQVSPETIKELVS